MEIIGVEHEGEEIQNAVIAHIDNSYPNLKKIMLELPPDYEMCKCKTYSRLYTGWFYDIAHHYERKSVKVITGDKNEGGIYNLTLEQVLDLSKNNPEKLLSMREKAGGDIKSSLKMCLSKKFNRKFIQDRNEGMDEVFKQEKPEVVVVGAEHAKYLKQNNPQAYFSCFVTKSLIERYAARYRNADIIYQIIDNDLELERQKEYARNFRNCLVGGALAGLGMVASLKSNIPIAPQLLCGAGSAILGYNLRGSVYYLRTLGRNNFGGEK